jgi:hypothetical protein
MWSCHCEKGLITFSVIYIYIANGEVLYVFIKQKTKQSIR